MKIGPLFRFFLWRLLYLDGDFVRFTVDGYVVDRQTEFIAALDRGGKARRGGIGPAQGYGRSAYLSPSVSQRRRTVVGIDAGAAVEMDFAADRDFLFLALKTMPPPLTVVS
ncbi:hypothetical protein [Methylosarcina fibrata]|nr:hypothetical protein [Methylosarcina fibrata]